MKGAHKRIDFIEREIKHFESIFCSDETIFD